MAKIDHRNDQPSTDRLPDGRLVVTVQIIDADPKWRFCFNELAADHRFEAMGIRDETVVVARFNGDDPPDTVKQDLGRVQELIDDANEQRDAIAARDHQQESAVAAWWRQLKQPRAVTN